MRTLGIDLSSMPPDTAVCMIDWSGAGAKVVSLKVGVTDEEILAFAKPGVILGIDAPFGWPTPFVDFVNLVQSGSLVPSPFTPELRDHLRFRLTDHRVKERFRMPLAVAAEKIALPAMRCAGLLSALGVEDRSGDGRVFEVYPAAARVAWNLNVGKEDVNEGGLDKLGLLVQKLYATCPWLAISEDDKALLSKKLDALDALVASLATRAAVCGLTISPQPHEMKRARIEGWIHVPMPSVLSQLPTAICCQAPVKTLA